MNSLGFLSVSAALRDDPCASRDLGQGEWNAPLKSNVILSETRIVSSAWTFHSSSGDADSRCHTTKRQNCDEQVDTASRGAAPPAYSLTSLHFYSLTERAHMPNPSSSSSNQNNSNAMLSGALPEQRPVRYQLQMGAPSPLSPTTSQTRTKVSCSGP